MDLSIISVTWNSADRILEQVQSVQRGCSTHSCEQITIDNASTDKTVSLLTESTPQVTVLVNQHNTGFAAANNQGVEVATGRYFLFLNPDTRVEPDSLDKAIRWMDEHPEVGIMSPKLVDQNGAFNYEAGPRRFPGLLDQAAVIVKLPHLFPHLLDRYLMKDIDPNVEREVDSVRGSCMFMRREVVEKLGWAFDPRYYIWFEDVDSCREARALGYSVVYSPVISCVDYIGQSFKQRDTFWKQQQFTTSMIVYFKKWEPWWKWYFLAALRPVGLSLVWLRRVL